MSAKVFVIDKEDMEEDIIKNLNIEIDIYKEQWESSHNKLYLETVERLEHIKYKLLKSANFYDC